MITHQHELEGQCLETLTADFVFPLPSLTFNQVSSRGPLWSLSQECKQDNCCHHFNSWCLLAAGEWNMDEIEEFHNRNGFNCEMNNITETAKMCTQFIKIRVFSTIISVFTGPKTNELRNNMLLYFDVTHTHRVMSNRSDNALAGASTHPQKCNQMQDATWLKTDIYSSDEHKHKFK